MKHFDAKEILEFAQVYLDTFDVHSSESNCQRYLNFLGSLFNFDFHLNEDLDDNELIVINSLLEDDLYHLHDIYFDLFSLRRFKKNLNSIQFVEFIQESNRRFESMFSIKKRQDKMIQDLKRESSILNHDDLFNIELIKKKFIATIPDEVEKFISNAEIIIPDYENIETILSKLIKNDFLFDIKCNSDELNFHFNLDYLSGCFLLSSDKKSNGLILDLKIIMNHEDENFKNEFCNFLREYGVLSKTKNSREIVSRKTEDRVFKYLSDIKFEASQFNEILSLDLFLPNGILPNKRTGIDEFKRFHTVLLSILYDDQIVPISSEFLGYTSDHINRYFKGMHSYGDESIVFLKRLTIFYFLAKNNLTEFISDRRINPLNFETRLVDFNFLSYKESGNDLIYLNLMEKTSYAGIENLIANFTKEIFSYGYYCFCDAMNVNILNMHNKIRNLFNNNIYLLPAIKSNLKRYYDEFSLDQNILIKLLKQEKAYFRSGNIKRASKYLKAMGICDGLEIENDTETGISKISLVYGSKITNLADEGHGVSQATVLCLLLDIVNRSKAYKNQPVVLVEEPEISLHPSLQSRLADILKIAFKEDGIQCIVETHSEYLVRKLQFLTAKGELKPGDVALYYFNSPDSCENGQERFYKIEITKSGSLTKSFGTGFFDEADNIAIDLLFINQNQTN